jgi:hypothetical protein
MLNAVMLARLAASILGFALVLGPPAVSHSQDTGTTSTPYIRVEWELQAPRGAYRNMCGRVFNNRNVTGRRVELLAEGLDTSGQVVSSRFKEVLGDVPVSGYSYFCVPLQSGAATYRVSVRSVDWGFAGQ